MSPRGPCGPTRAISAFTLSSELTVRYVPARIVRTSNHREGTSSRTSHCTLSRTFAYVPATCSSTAHRSQARLGYSTSTSTFPANRCDKHEVFPHERLCLGGNRDISISPVPCLGADYIVPIWSCRPWTLSGAFCSNHVLEDVP